MRVKSLIVAFCLTLTGCAGLAADECRDGADWYQIGQRDGRLGASPQADLYASRCGVQPDAARYTQGWQAGFAARPVPNW